MEPGEEAGVTGAPDAVAGGVGGPAPVPSVPVDWEALARAAVHPLRISILEMLGIDGGRRMSANELSLELQAPLSNTNYQVGRLAGSGLIARVGERQVRGAVEHFYRLAADETDDGPQP